jgi:sulfotransferase family protein
VRDLKLSLIPRFSADSAHPARGSVPWPPAAGRREDGPILILGAPRSGTTWLAKILDSHPNVLYRHEPDVALPCDALPGICRADQLAALLPRARVYWDELTGLATLRSAGSLPIFRKAYNGPWSHYWRLGLIWAARLGSTIVRDQDLWGKLPIPDRISRKRSPPRIVVKSVISLGRAALYAEARPDLRMILLVRHPCGQIASMLRGISLEKFAGPLHLNGILATEQARRHGLSSERFRSMRPLEQLAWNWAILNEKALEELSDRNTVKVVLYEDLCLEPLSVARDLFDFVGLDWPAQTEAFLRRSMSLHGPERYYQVFRDTRTALAKWRTQLSQAEQESVHAIVRQTTIGRLCLGLQRYLAEPLERSRPVIGATG